MLGYDDKVYLSVANVVNRDGEKYLISISLPNDFEFIGFPEDVAKVSIYESERKKIAGRKPTFNILVGNVSTLEKLYEENEHIVVSKLFFNTEELLLDEIEQPICYYKDEDDNCVILSKVREGDIVVKDVEELEEKIMDISYDFDKIQRSINRIKKYVYKK